MNIIHGIIGLFKSTFNIGIVDPKVKSHRLTLCLICSDMNRRKGNRCNLCGCYIRHKIRLKSEKCPKDEW